MAAIKTVKGLTGEEYEYQFYSKHLETAKAVAIKYGLYAGMAMGITFCFMFLDYALSFYYGSVLIGD